MKKILRINLEKSTQQLESVPENYAGLGGRALSSKIIGAEVAPQCDPLAAENKLVLAPGLLAGTTVLCSGRLSIGTKSPLTDGIKEANAGGALAGQLAKLGLQAIIIEGRAGKSTVLKIDKKGVTFKAAGTLKGKGVYHCLDALKTEYGEDVGIIAIGPAGEMKLKAAAIAVSTRDFHPRFAARGGVGAVMGAKNLKAIVVEDVKGGKVDVADKTRLNEAAKALSKGVMSHPLMGALKDLGTPVLVNMINSMGALCTQNFSQGKFEGAAKISGETLAGLTNQRPNSKPAHACMKGCTVQCSNILTDEKGKLICASIEFETLALIGSNCMIDDIEMVAKINYACNDVGLDTMDIGGALAVAMEGGMLAWGDGKAVRNLVKSIPKGDEKALMIGNGRQFTGEKLGVKRIPTVKRQCLAAYDPRGLKGTGVTYATAPMGADHTCGNVLPSPTQPDYNPQAATGQAGPSQFLQKYFAAIDSLGLCLFPSLAILDIPELMPHLVGCVSAVTGHSLPENYVDQLGLSVNRTERTFNRAAGFTRVDDRLPDFFVKEKLPGLETTFDVSTAELDSVHEV